MNDIILSAQNGQPEEPVTPSNIPRMRTAAGIVAELRALDPGTGVSENFIRQLVREGALPVVWAGSKALINLDDVLALLRSGTSQPEPAAAPSGGIRRLDAKLKNWA